MQFLCIGTAHDGQYGLSEIFDLLYVLYIPQYPIPNLFWYLLLSAGMPRPTLLPREIGPRPLPLCLL
jgi:hypothetical protein